MDASPTYSHPRELYLRLTPKYRQPLLADAERDIPNCFETQDANLMHTVLS
jgi:hypothetical protein